MSITPNFSLIETTLGEYGFSPAYDLLSTSVAIPDDKEESALTINGKKNKLNRNDFNALASSLHINEKPLQAIYNRFDTILPIWISWVGKSFLSKQLKKDYIELLHKRHKKIFS